MQNTYREIKKIVRANNLNSDQIVHALIGTIFGNCCDECVEKIRSDEFLKAVEHIAGELQVCAELSKSNAA